MSQTAMQEPIYDDRVNATLRGLAEGRTREDLAQEFGLSGWKSLDVSMRRKGFTWDSERQTYVPNATKVDRILDETASRVPVKAEQIIRRFEREDADPWAIAKEMGFDGHREMAQYMERKGLVWDPERGNYAERIAAGINAGSSAEAQLPGGKVVSLPGRTTASQQAAAEPEDLRGFLPLLQILERHRDRLMDLLLPASVGHIPKYAVPGVPKTKSIYMSDLLARLVTEFSDSKNLSQREVVEAALVEYLKRYGYQQEVGRLLGKS